ncbi:MAG: ADP-forming succinate--CoA ligase subunit beta [Kiloniellaceae bacterium]
MYVHEYQAKELLRRYGVRTPRGAVARSPAEAEAVARDLRGSPCMVKAQIHAGGRGKAGGVRMVRSIDQAKAAATEMLGSSLVTYQTGAEGKRVKAVYVEERIEAARELYLAALVDRGAGRVALLASAAGGEDIEEAAAQDPSMLHRLVVDPAVGLPRDGAHGLAAELGVHGAAAEAAAEIMAGVYTAFVELDASLIEINPLAVTEAGELLAVDVKMGFDDNALFRHPEVAALRDEDEVDPAELEAARYEINYVKLDGDIGCMVNGAGLALATVDLIKQCGGEPADFMDVRPVATRQQVATGFRMILRNPKVKAILVNIYGGGILRCDTIAEGIAAAVRETGLGAPLIVRAAGTNMEIAKKTLIGQAIPAVFADDMAEAARKAVEAAKRAAA